MAKSTSSASMMAEPHVPEGMAPFLVPTADSLIAAGKHPDYPRENVLAVGREYIADGKLSPKDRIRLAASGYPELGPGRS
jgi:hypothetical protein